MNFLFPLIPVAIETAPLRHPNEAGDGDTHGDGTGNSSSIVQFEDWSDPSDNYHRWLSPVGNPLFL